MDILISDYILIKTSIEHFRYTVPPSIVPKLEGFLRDVVPKLDDRRFKSHFRVSKPCFQYILELISTDEVFISKGRRSQAPISDQLYITLFCLGTSGTITTHTVATLFGVGDGGTVNRYINRVIKAILKLKPSVLSWPTEAERKIIQETGLNVLPGCIGFVDGTEIRLEERPLINGDRYISRKQQYSLKLQITCDMNLNILHAVCGYPGSAHDARIFNNCALSVNSEKFFSNGQFLIGDSAYKLTKTVLTPFRTNATLLQPQIRSHYNTEIGKYRVRVEHIIGIIKQRFASLKNLGLQISDESSIKRANDWIFSCLTLHNIITHFESDDPMDQNLELLQYPPES